MLAPFSKGCLCRPANSPVIDVSNIAAKRPRVDFEQHRNGRPLPKPLLPRLSRASLATIERGEVIIHHGFRMLKEPR
jgi:hypothetical protein